MQILMNPKYLPSRKFVATIIILVVLTGLVFGISKLVGYLKYKFGVKPPTKLVQVKDLVQKDTNGNGIPDWEESLWGLDPTKDGPANKEFIVSQRAKLANNLAIEDGTVVSPENAELSKEFFAVIMSLQESGSLDQDSIKAVSDMLGQRIVATPIDAIYTRAMLKKIVATDATTETYFKSVGRLMDSYKNKDMGNELNLISQGLMRNDPQATLLAGNIGAAYHSFGQELIKIPVPTTLVDLDLALANDYARVAQSIGGLTQILKNPIVGMRSLINYKNYSDALVADIENLSDNY